MHLVTRTQAAVRKEAKDARRLEQRGGGVTIQQLQQQQQQGLYGDVYAHGGESGGGLGAGADLGTAPANLHFQFAGFERHTNGRGPVCALSARLS